MVIATKDTVKKKRGQAAEEDLSVPRQLSAFRSA
jgi:hypothetical protein